MRLLAVVLFCIGCAPRMRFPGPTSAVGRKTTPIAAELAREAERERAREQKGQALRGGPGERVAEAADSFIGKDRLVVHGERYRWDCSGFVTAAYAKAGWDYAGSSADLFEQAQAAGVVHKSKIPRVGDVAFFDDTYDRNKNGRRDDSLSHVAIVESVDAAGNITLVHKGSKGVVRLHMNLKRPHDERDESGVIINDQLRAAKNKDHGPVLTAELFRAFGSLWQAPGTDALADH